MVLELLVGNVWRTKRSAFNFFEKNVVNSKKYQQGVSCDSFLELIY